MESIPTCLQGHKVVFVVELNNILECRWFIEEGHRIHELQHPGRFGWR
jgi:hypothetical protein